MTSAAALLLEVLVDDLSAKEKAQLWINHDKAQRHTLKMAPDYYD
jgi:N-acyl homoserine lactone hydrolase